MVPSKICSWHEYVFQAFLDDKLTSLEVFMYVGIMSFLWLLPLFFVQGILHVLEQGGNTNTAVAFSVLLVLSRITKIGLWIESFSW